MYKTKIGDLQDFFKITSELEYIVGFDNEKETEW